ncbi:MAG: TolC family protein [Bacteroidota bacterium]
MKLFYLSLISAALISASAVIAQDSTVPARTFTLQQALEAGLANSRELKISRSKFTQSEARLTETTSQLLPQLKFMAGYTRLSDVPPFEITLPVPGLPVNHFRVSESIPDNYNLRLSLQQPVFTGFRLTSIRKAAAENRTASEMDYSRDYNESAFRIHSGFWQFYKAQQILKSVNESLASSEKHLEDTRNFLEQGLVTQNDLLKLEVQYSNTKLQQIEAANNLEIARASFNQLIGLPLNENTDISAPGIEPASDSRSFQEYVSEAKTNRTELKAMLHRLDATGYNIDAAKAGWFPQIYLTGNYYYNRPNQRIQPPKDRFDDTWDIGVTLSWDIWNWGYTSAQTAQAEQTKVQTETGLAQLNENIEIEVYQNYLSLQRAAERIAVSKKSLEQSDENLRTLNDKYNHQLATSTDLIDAESLLLQAQTNYNTSLVDYQLALVRLQKSIGRKIYQ